jgi:hypothetical protein
MSVQRIRRRWLDFTITMAMYLAMAYAGAGWWALLIFPFALWNYYDGLTRSDLPR